MDEVTALSAGNLSSVSADIFGVIRQGRLLIFNVDCSNDGSRSTLDGFLLIIVRWRSVKVVVLVFTIKRSGEKFVCRHPLLHV